MNLIVSQTGQMSALRSSTANEALMIEPMDVDEIEGMLNSQYEHLKLAKTFEYRACFDSRYGWNTGGTLHQDCPPLS